MKSGFKRTINWSKYHLKVIIQRQKQYLDYLIDPSFQGVYRLFVLSLDNAHRRSYNRYFIPTVEIKDYNVMINGQSCFDDPVKSDLKTNENIQKIETGKGNDYTTDCLLNFPYFKEH